MLSNTKSSSGNMTRTQQTFVEGINKTDKIIWILSSTSEDTNHNEVTITPSQHLSFSRILQENKAAF